jgi:hypothetical protein
MTFEIVLIIVWIAVGAAIGYRLAVWEYSVLRTKQLSKENGNG